MLVFWLIITAQLCLLSGCATLPAPQLKAPVASDFGRTLLNEHLSRRTENRTLQGIARIRVQTPERTVSGTQVLLVEEPARLRAETLSPFGTPLLLMTANDTEINVLVPGDNRFYQGRATPENLGRFTRLPLRLADLVSILLFRPPLIDYQSLETFQLSDGGWMAVLEAGQRRQELLFDVGQHLSGVRYFHGGELQLRLAYGDFDATPQLFPHRIELELPQQKTQASLVFKELEVNRQILPEVFALVPPAGALVTILDEMDTLQTSPPLESR
ncbi:MAG: DUF4292 domain-containing protein [Desulfuromonadales bacterium]|nr:DUF4292 domain-containing protein [Desulfuromonadales bacterium]